MKNSRIQTLFLYDGQNRLKVMIDFLKRVLTSDEESAANVLFSSLVTIDEVLFPSLVTIDEDIQSTEYVAQLDEFSSCILARACAHNINETELFLPFHLQDELVNLVEIMRHEHTTGVKIMRFDPGDPIRIGSNKLHKSGFIAHFTGRFRAMLAGTSRIGSVNIQNRVTAAMNLMNRPAVLCALSRLTRRPLPEFFISTHKAWLTKKTGAAASCSSTPHLGCANCIATALLLGLGWCTRI